MGWQTQTLPRSDYELILVAPSDFLSARDCEDCSGPRIASTIPIKTMTSAYRQ